MIWRSFLIVFGIVVFVEGNLYSEYFPEERRQRHRNKEDYERYSAREVEKPNPWLRAKQRAQFYLKYYGHMYDSRARLKPMYRRSSGERQSYHRGNTQQSMYRSYQKGPRTSSRNYEYRYPARRTYNFGNVQQNMARNHYEKGPRTGSQNYEYRYPSARRTYNFGNVEQTTVRNQYAKGPRTGSQNYEYRNPSGRRTYNNRNTDRRTNRPYEKGPRTGARGDNFDEQRGRQIYNTGNTERRNSRQNYVKGPRTGSREDEYRRLLGRQTYNKGNLEQTSTRTYAKGPRTGYRGDRNENRHQSGRYVYRAETVEEKARRYVNGGHSHNWKNSVFQYRAVTDPTTDPTTVPTTVSTTIAATDPTTVPTTVLITVPTKDPRVRTATEAYQGCVDAGMYCNYWKSIGCCEEELGRKYCTKTCGFCSPQQTLCPSSYKFGCCWDGTKALDPWKKSCPKCEDSNSNICEKEDVYKDCDLHRKNSLPTRKLCPVTCGACFDYSDFVS